MADVFAELYPSLAATPSRRLNLGTSQTTHYRPPDVGPSLIDIPAAVGGAAWGGLHTLLEMLNVPGNAVRGLLTNQPETLLGFIPFHKSLFNIDVPLVSGREVLEDLGLASRNKPGFDWEDIPGFMTEVLTDPLMFMPLGQLTKVGRAGKALSKLATHKIALEGMVRNPAFKANHKMLGELLDQTTQRIAALEPVVAQGGTKRSIVSFGLPFMEEVGHLGDFAKISGPVGKGWELLSKVPIIGKLTEVPGAIASKFRFLPRDAQTTAGYDLHRMVMQRMSRMDQEKAANWVQLLGKRFTDADVNDLSNYIEFHGVDFRQAQDDLSQVWEVLQGMRPGTKTSARKLYELTPDEFIKKTGLTAADHRQAVEAAIKAGADIPLWHSFYYPDLLDEAPRSMFMHTELGPEIWDATVETPITDLKALIADRLKRERGRLKRLPAYDATYAGREAKLVHETLPTPKWAQSHAFKITDPKHYSGEMKELLGRHNELVDEFQKAARGDSTQNNLETAVRARMNRIAARELVYDQAVKNLHPEVRPFLDWMIQRTHDDLIRNMGEGLPESMLRDPYMGYLHHLITPSGREWLHRTGKNSWDKYLFHAKKFGVQTPAQHKRKIAESLVDANKGMREAGYDGAEEFFETDVVKAFLNRANQSSMAYVRHHWLKSALQQFSEDSFGHTPHEFLTVPEILSKLRYSGWEGLQWSKGASPEKIAEIFDRSGLGQLSQYGLPKQVLDDMLTPFEVMKNPGPFFRKFDKLMSVMRGSVTSVWPLYHIRNALGNFWNGGILGGVWEPKYYTEAIDLIKAHARGTMTKQQKRIWDAAQDARVWYRFADPTLSDILQTTADDIAETFFYNPRQWLKRRFNLPENTPIPVPGYADGIKIENTMRLAHFIGRHKKYGETFAEAAASVRKYLFNYDELSKFEKNVMRRLAFFYTWTRKNTPLVFEHALSPQVRLWANTIGVTDEKPEDLPSWMADAGVWVLAQDDSTGLFTTLDLGLPVQEPFALSSFKRIASLMNPVMRGLVETAGGTSLYTGKRLQDLQQANTALGWVAQVAQDLSGVDLGVREMPGGGRRMDPRLNWLFGYLPTARLTSIPTLGKAGIPNFLFNLSVGKLRTTYPRRGKPTLYDDNFETTINRLINRGDMYKFEQYWGNTPEGQQAARYLLPK